MLNSVIEMQTFSILYSPDECCIDYEVNAEPHMSDARITSFNDWN